MHLKNDTSVISAQFELSKVFFSLIAIVFRRPWFIVEHSSSKTYSQYTFFKNCKVESFIFLYNISSEIIFKILSDVRIK